MGEKDDAYIVMTNHNSCEFSYDENDNLTDVPMTQFGNGYSSTSVSGLDGSGTRFWTLWWLAREQFGRIDEYVAMNDYWTNEFYIDEEGTRRDPSTGRTVGGGNVNTQCSVPADSKNFWTVAAPPDWVGPWDYGVIKENFPKKIK
ncbi:MAG: hypothetical protein H6Q43_1418 [Deltaproteobacteria bacterium]|jgi:hypothetical protein|nr:hypothetical protein [Deltaproteobacteria bacterium]